MIRVLLGSAMPVLAIGAAAFLVGPDLVAAPRGEPILVAAPGAEAALQKASFDAADCAGVRVLALTVRSASGGLVVTIQEGASGALPDDAYQIAVDAAGRVLATGHPDDIAQAVAAGCGPGIDDPEVHGSI